MSAAVRRAALLASCAGVVVLIALQFSLPLLSMVTCSLTPTLRRLQSIASTFPLPAQHAMAGNLGMKTPLLRLRDGNSVPMVCLEVIRHCRSADAR